MTQQVAQPSFWDRIFDLAETAIDRALPLPSDELMQGIPTGVGGTQTNPAPVVNQTLLWLGIGLLAGALLLKYVK